MENCFHYSVVTMFLAFSCCYSVMISRRSMLDSLGSDAADKNISTLLHRYSLLHREFVAIIDRFRLTDLPYILLCFVVSCGIC